MIQEVTTTLKVHLVTSDSDKEALVEVSEAYRAACEYISDYVFESVLKTVLAKYAAVRSNGHPRTRIRFRVPQCDLVRGMDWSYTDGMLSVNTIRGRLKLPFYGQSDFTDHGCRFGGARLLFDGRRD